MFDLTIDHYTIKVNELKRSTHFYGTVLGLSEITNQTGKDYIRWFSLGNGSELHVVEGDTSEIKTPIGVHLALRMADFDNFLEHLRSHNITPHNSKGKSNSITTRADSVRQVYFPDPDGYWIEVNEAAAK
jgi:catechol 2,3-dioxygenase-like lactoylglutathione lyase family enzyme